MARTILLCGAMLAFCAGCMKQVATGTPPAPPTPPQITVANSTLALSHALSGATDALIECRNQQKCSQQDVAAAEGVIAAMAQAGKGIDTELRSTDDWPTQKTKILSLVGMAGVAQAKARVSASAQLFIVSIVAIYNNISLAVGGPTF